MKKRIISIILIFATMATLLVGCGSSKELPPAMPASESKIEANKPEKNDTTEDSVTVEIDGITYTLSSMDDLYAMPYEIQGKFLYDEQYKEIRLHFANNYLTEEESNKFWPYLRGGWSKQDPELLKRNAENEEIRARIKDKDYSNATFEEVMNYSLIELFEGYIPYVNTYQPNLHFTEDQLKQISDHATECTIEYYSVYYNETR